MALIVLIFGRTLFQLEWHKMARCLIYLLRPWILPIKARRGLARGFKLKLFFSLLSLFFFFTQEVLNLQYQM